MMAPGRIRRRLLSWIASIGALKLILFSALIIVPTSSYAMYPFVVGAGEMSPFLLLFDVLWCVVVLRVFCTRVPLEIAPENPTRRRVLRLTRREWGYTLAIMLGVSAFIAARPLFLFSRVASSAARQLGDSDNAPRFSLMTALRGLPAPNPITERDVHYMAQDGAPLTMRLFNPVAKGVHPTVVVLYGGAWRGGTAMQCANVSRALASLGYTVTAIDYRHAPKFHFPAHIDDVRRSLLMLRDSAAVFGIDTARMAILGRSAGGHLAELAAFTSRDIHLRAVIAIYAPYDLEQGYLDLPSPDPIDVRQVLRDFIGGAPADVPNQYVAASPSSYVQPGLPPTMLLFGGNDHVIKPSFNIRAAHELRAARIPTVAVELPWAEHGFDMAPSGLGAQLAFYAITTFLKTAMQH